MDFKELQIPAQEPNTFVEDVCQTQIVFSLKSEEGYAMSESMFYEDEEGYPLEMICFWSDDLLAKKCKQDDWANNELEAMPLAEFVEKWCIGLSNNGILLSMNIAPNLQAHESDPLEIALEIIETLEAQDKELKLEHYSSMSELKKQIVDILSAE